MKPTVSLAAIKLFSGLEAGHIAKLESCTLHRTLERGETLFMEGDEARAFYLVRSGRLKVYKSSPQGREQILHFVGPGELVGEVVMFSGGRLPACAEAIERTEVLSIPRKTFVDLVRQEPEVAMRLLAALSERLRELTALVENLSLREVTERLASYIIFMSETRGRRDQIELELPRHELAALLGTVPETLSRAFAKLEQQGLISQDRRKILIQDRVGLRDVAWAGR